MVSLVSVNKLAAQEKDQRWCLAPTPAPRTPRHPDITSIVLTGAGGGVSLGEMCMPLSFVTIASEQKSHSVLCADLQKSFLHRSSFSSVHGLENHTF